MYFDHGVMVPFGKDPYILAVIYTLSTHPWGFYYFDDDLQYMGL